MFVDKISNLFIKAGRGGDGRRSASAFKKPDGGDGGKGGDVYLVGNSNYYDLTHLTSSKEYKAEDGEIGGKKRCNGRNGRDLELQVPLITKVYNLDGKYICEIKKHGEKIKLLEGGMGGKGNYFYRTRFKGYERVSSGIDGEMGCFNFELELYSDIIFIGYPNAGKSSILNALTNASAKVGAYPFTTINPQQGRMGDITLLDLPGLIEFTYKGKGLGTKFVKHTRSAKLIAHMISLENVSVVEVYQKIRFELEQIGDGLNDKPEVVVLTKSDLVDDNKINDSINEIKKFKKEVIAVSFFSKSDMKNLEKFFRRNLDGVITGSKFSTKNTD